MEEGHDVECVTEMMQLFSAGKQRRVNVVTCILVHRHMATSQEGVMNVHLCLRPFSNSFVLDCNTLLHTIQFSDTLTPEVQSTIQKLLSVSFSHSSDSVT